MVNALAGVAAKTHTKLQLTIPACLSPGRWEQIKKQQCEGLILSQGKKATLARESNPRNWSLTEDTSQAEMSSSNADLA